MSLRTQAAKRRNSYIEIEGNPLETGVVPEGLQVKLENLSDAKPIEDGDLKNMIKYIKAQGDNDKKVKAVDELKNAFLFSSDDLLQILETTPSVKTRIRIIGLIGPRLTDPKAKSGEILGLFRYAEEKNQVEEILKHRAHTVANNVYVSKPASGPGRGGMVLGGGRGGRGRGGRGLRSTSPMPATTPMAPEPEPEKVSSPAVSRRATSPVPFGGPKGSNPLDTKARSPRESPRAASPEEDEEVMAGSRAPFSSLDTNIAPEDTTPVSEATVTPEPPAVSTETSEAQPEAASSPSEPEVETATSATIMDGLVDAPESTPTTDEASAIDAAPATEHSTPDVEKFNSIDVEITSVSSSTSLAQQIDQATTPSVLPFHRPARRSSVSDSVLRSLGLSEETLDEAPEEMWLEKYEKRVSQNEVQLQQEIQESDQVEDANGRMSNDQQSEQPTEAPAEETQEDKEERISNQIEDAPVPETDNAATPVTPRKESADGAEAPSTGLRAWFRRISFTKTPANTPAPVPDASAMDRQPRSSLQKLQEEKKVGMIRRLFERKGESPEPKPDGRRDNVASDVRKSQLMSAPCEGPIGKDESGRDLFSYHELVRRNTTKDFRGINPNELELYLSEEEFIMRFNSTKEEFSELPKWRRTERKKALLLF